MLDQRQLYRSMRATQRLFAPTEEIEMQSLLLPNHLSAPSLDNIHDMT